MQLDITFQKKRMIEIVGHDLDSKFVIRRFYRAIDLYLDELEKNLYDSKPLIEKLAWGNSKEIINPEITTNHDSTINLSELEKDGLIISDLKDIDEISFGYRSTVLWEKEICSVCSKLKGNCKCGAEHIKISEEKLEWD